MPPTTATTTTTSNVTTGATGTTSRVGRRVRLPVHLVNDVVTESVRTAAGNGTTTSAPALVPKKLRTMRNLLSRGKRRNHPLRLRSVSIGGSGGGDGDANNPSRKNSHSDISNINNNNNNNNNDIKDNKTTQSGEVEDRNTYTMKTKEQCENFKNFDKNSGSEIIMAAAKPNVNVNDVENKRNGKITDGNKSEIKPPPLAPAITLSNNEKILYDTRIRRKNVLALNEKVAAIREYEKAPVYKRVGRIFHCSPDQIKRIVQQKDSILEAWEQRTRRCQDAKTLEMKVVRVSMLGKAVYDWLRRMIYYQDIQITDGLIQKTALQFKSAMGLQNFFPHQDWCDKFRQTYKIHTADSKMLNIGYTQGYSVQIKDVMKDVLNECTPDACDDFMGDCDDEENGEENKQVDSKDSGANGGVPNVVIDDDDDDDDDVLEVKEDEIKKVRIPINESGKETTTAGTSSKRNPTIPKTNKTKNDAPNNTTIIVGNSINLPSATPITSAANRICVASPNTINSNLAASSARSSSTSPSFAKAPTSEPPPLRQLLALPLQGNVPGMPQKVLVATPITPAAGGGGGSGGQVPGLKPMTMTIIPLASIAQSQSKQQASASSAATKSNAALATANAATPATDAEKSAVPPPMVDIKMEIKQEPPEIKQECISDEEEKDEEMFDEHGQTQRRQPNEVAAHRPQAAATDSNRRSNAISSPTNASIDNNSSACSCTDSDDDRVATEPADDENIALANLRRLIQTQGKIVDTAPSPGANTIPPPKSVPISIVSRTPTTSPCTIPPLAPRPMLTPATLVPFSTIGDRTFLPTTTNAITCIPAANLAAMTSRSLNFTPPLPPLTKAPDAVISRLANKRKHPSGRQPIAPPIKSCAEARKYLKLLEDFALVKESFRLIGLITRADEVLRELDGDDDVDVD